MPVFTERNWPLTDVDCDVCIIGSGAGGSTLAAQLCQAGLDVILLEAGPYHTQKDFDMDEATAFQQRYQEQGLRSTDDLAITILQGRGVGGSTTINWTSCFRTPDRILSLWREHFGTVLTSEMLLPHFEAVEKRLNIATWNMPPNPNNAIIANGAKKLGWEFAPLRRNVKGCYDSGYCGMGCPTNAKQGMLLTYIPDALEHGLRLYAQCSAEKIHVHNQQVSKIEVHTHTGDVFLIHPKICVSSGGAINGPALFLKSDLNWNEQVGLRTFIHPVTGLAAIFEEPVLGWYGAPQSVSSHHFIERGDGKVGFFFEAAPTHPIIAASAASGFGIIQQQFMSKLSHTGFLIALHRDGVLGCHNAPSHSQSIEDQGGQVTVNASGRIQLSYPIHQPLQESFKESMKMGAKLALAAGAQQVQSLHNPGIAIQTEQDISQLDLAQYGSLHHGIFTAHQMGGLCMGADPKSSVVNPYLQHHQIKNLFAVDGSVFPTSLGVNPSQSIYGIAHWASQNILQAL